VFGQPYESAINPFSVEDVIEDKKAKITSEKRENH